MARKNVLLIEDDQKTEANIGEILGDKYTLGVAPGIEAAIDYVKKTPPHLIIIDYDLQGTDGLQVFKKLRQFVPQVSVLMLSVSNSIPLAVAASKMGVAEFLRKPLEADQFLLSVEKNVVASDFPPPWITDIEWLRGDSRKIKDLYNEILKSLLLPKNILLLGETGIETEQVAEFLHGHSLKRYRQFKVLDLASFRHESQETHFWGTVQEIIGEVEVSSILNEEDRCGTLFLKNIETLESGFALSILEFFKERKGKVDKEILVLIGLNGRQSQTEVNLAAYNQLIIPPLRERKEDLPYLLVHYLAYYTAKYNKKISGVAPELLDFLLLYDYPGNYTELAKMVEQLVLRTAAEIIDLKSLPLGWKEIGSASIKKTFRTGTLGLNEAKKDFEKMLYPLLLAKVEGDVAAVARFIDLPKTVLTERLEHLG